MSTGSSEVLRASLFTDTAGIWDGCFLPVNLESVSHSSIKQTTGMTTEELASILQVERLRPSEPHQHPGVSQRTETSPELLAPCLSYITPSSSSPWKLRPIPWKTILFSPVFSRMQPAWSLALRIVREHPVFFLAWTECLPSWALFSWVVFHPAWISVLHMLGLYFEEPYFIYVYPHLYAKRIWEDLQQKK